MSESYFDALERQLAGLCRERAHRRTWRFRVPGMGRSASSVRLHRSGIVAMVASAAVVAGVVVLALALHSAPRPPGRPAGGGAAGISQRQRRAAQPYVRAAIDPAVSASCASLASVRGRVSYGAPSRSLVAILGVLRRPREPSDLPPPAPGAHRSIPVWAQGAYVRYVRRARVVAGISYYVVPMVNAGVMNGTCAAQAQRRLDRELPTIPAGLRGVVRQLAEHQIANLGPHQGVILVETGPNISGGFGGTPASAIKQTGIFGSDQTRDGARVVGLLPDGVASVQIIYTAARGSDTPKPFSITAPVVNNVMVVSVPRTGEAALHGKMVWRAANGTVIRTISQH
ncbi:MAG TPA: hypothetical protein VMA77_29820 [Solirubrobacteraceae bacterium]|nr:hypothetical protein [Solirubrobacteraceae bacterium]